MEIFLANPRGFCAGVKRAITVVNRALEKYGSPVYVLHEIVHNSHVINTLANKGAIFVETLEEIPSQAVTIFSAHGVAKDVEDRAKALNLNTIDATCPLVSRVHRRVARLNKMGYDILIIGHKKHPEVEGTRGRAQGTVIVISKPEDLLEAADQNPDRVGYVTQTTLSTNDTAELIKLFKEKFPEINVPERTDICYATHNRQTAVRNLAVKVDLFLVVGSKNSSNSNRLREVARNCGVKSYLIDNVGEIDPAWLQDVEKIGITAGASAPEVLVEQVIAWLRNYRVTNIREMEGEEEYTKFKLPELPDFEYILER